MNLIKRIKLWWAPIDSSLPEQYEHIPTNAERRLAYERKRMVFGLVSAELGGVR